MHRLCPSSPTIETFSRLFIHLPASFLQGRHKSTRVLLMIQTLQLFLPRRWRPSRSGTLKATVARRQCSARSSELARRFLVLDGERHPATRPWLLRHVLPVALAPAASHTFDNFLPLSITCTHHAHHHSCSSLLSFGRSALWSFAIAPPSHLSSGKKKVVSLGEHVTASLRVPAFVCSLSLSLGALKFSAQRHVS